MSQILISTIIAVIIAAILGLLLGYFSKVFEIKKDPKLEAVYEALPHANCGACGFPGCEGLAEALIKNEVSINSCPVGGEVVAKELAKILGIEEQTGVVIKNVAVLLCQGTKDKAPDRLIYSGIETCRAAQISSGGQKSCLYGCLGFGDCVTVCPFDAIHMESNGLPHVDTEKCTGCGKCVKACPRKILTLVPYKSTGAIALCSNRNPKIQEIIKTCKVGCIKCEICVKACPKKAISMKNGLPIVDYSLCDSCGVCVEKCPTKVFKLLEGKVISGL